METISRVNHTVNQGDRDGSVEGMLLIPKSPPGSWEGVRKYWIAWYVRPPAETIATLARAVRVRRRLCITLTLMLLVNQQAVKPKSCIGGLQDHSVHGKTDQGVVVIDAHGMPRRQLISLFHTVRNTFDKLCLVWKYLQLLSSPAIFAGDRF